MDNLSEHNFDDLFREGSEKVEFEYREDAWAALDERLEEKDRKRRLLWILLGLALSTLLIGAIFYYSNKTQNGISETIPLEENVTITGLQNKISAETITAEVLSPTSEKNTHSSKVVDGNGLTNSVVRTTRKSATQQTNKINFAQKTEITKGQISEQKTNNFSVSIEDEVEILPPNNNSNLDTKQDTQSAEPTIYGPKKLALIKKIAPIVRPSLQEITNDVIEENVDEFAKKTKLQEGAKNQFTIGIFGSLDYNSLSLGNDKIEQGYRIGLRTDYNFARRFSLGIGAAFSRKDYTAQGFRYNAKAGFWTDGIAPIEVQAISNVIEVPLELRFYAKGHNQDGFFAGTGINSYHITLEQYNFYYEEIFANTITNWEERGTNTNIFSVASFTIGYQKTVNSNLAFQIAPFVNLPLTGIGQGKVNLQSVGLNVAVNWRK